MMKNFLSRTFVLSAVLIVLLVIGLFTSGFTQFVYYTALLAGIAFGIVLSEDGGDDEEWWL